jgi:hypothetical protein
MLKKAWNKLRCTNGKVFSRYTVCYVVSIRFMPPFLLSCHLLALPRASPTRRPCRDPDNNKEGNLQVPNPTSLGSRSPQARTSNSPCNPAIQNNTIAAAKQRVRSGNRST